MFDRDAPSSRRALAEFGKESVRARIHRYAVWRTQSEADADDLLADALVLVLDPKARPWDPAKRSFFRHMRFAMDCVAIGRARGGYARFEAVDPLPGERAPAGESLADEVLAEARDLSRLRDLGKVLRARIAGRDDLAARVFDAACAGTEEPADLARELGCRVEEVYEAIRRLKYHGARVKGEEEHAEAAKMKAARERATKAKPT